MYTKKREPASFSRGILLASNAKQEWMLPWWWENYQKHNTFSVTFIDLGLSEEGRRFCEGKGNLVPFIHAQNPLKSTDPEIASRWEEIYGGVLWKETRPCWHKKPFALLQTPYEYTIWLDTDCEVRSSLHPLFSQIEKSERIVIRPSPKKILDHATRHTLLLEGEMLFNSGVIGYRKHSPEILAWAKATSERGEGFFGDDQILSRIIHENGWSVTVLDPSYNRQELEEGQQPGTKISHWAGQSGKFFISLKMQNAF